LEIVYKEEIWLQSQGIYWSLFASILLNPWERQLNKGPGYQEEEKGTIYFIVIYLSIYSGGYSVNRDWTM
jgi:hypothetical protein